MKVERGIIVARFRFIVLTTASICLIRGAAQAQMSRPLQPKPGIDRSVEVPLLYEQPARGHFRLDYEIGRAFDRRKPTVFIIADGQQFYVRKGLIAPLQDELFGPQFNVVGIIGRGNNEAVKRQFTQPAGIDWRKAYEILKSSEWVEDIESVRKDLLGAEGRICMYGRSGGGLLVHQYLAKHPRHVSNVFTQSAVNRFVDAELGLSSDTFWSEIGSYDASLQPLLLEALARHPAERNRIILLLQRQNFFVPLDRIAAERNRLIHALYAWDQQAIARDSKQYQVDAVLGDQDPASSVRVFELFAPVFAEKKSSSPARVDPDIEAGRIFAGPLLRLFEDGLIAGPSMDLAALYTVRASVFMLAGRFDHTADYRSQIALAAHYPHHRLLLLADDHDFLRLSQTGLYPRLVQTALLDGINGPALAGVEQQLVPLIYEE